MDFKDILKTRRATLELTLDDIGRYVGVSGATVSRWENGEIANIRRDKIAKLAEILQVSPSYLMGWPEKTVTLENEFADAPDENYVILSRNAKKLSPEKRKQLLDMAKLMFKEEFDN